MSRFNLIDEKWISVIVDDRGATEEVSLSELFSNAHKYKRIAGDTRTQDFAVMRVILAILHTVFSRFDYKGDEYGYFDLDERYRQKEEIYEEDMKDYSEDLLETWENLWDQGYFSEIVLKYLDKWHDRFYLFDDKYPFYQVREEIISEKNINRKNPSSVSGKNINRLVSESGNKIALFSPKYETKKNKEILTDQEIARWLITFQGYTGLSDKVIFGDNKYQVPNSKGWLFDIGGIYISAGNIFESLMLNLVLVHPESKYRQARQKPCWEYSSEEIVKSYLSLEEVDNLASLYTNWSRAIYIDPETDTSKAFSFQIVKLPQISHQDQFLEPMTLWRYNSQGDNKDKFTPRKHQANRSLWRSFGLLTLTYLDGDDKKRKPIIMDWLRWIRNIIGDTYISLEAVSMEDDGNATSWVPTDEVCDNLKVNDYVITDLSEKGWVPRINELIEESKYVIDFIYKNFLLTIKEIRNHKSNDFVNKKIAEMYYAIDKPFRDWIFQIKLDDSKDEKVKEWKDILERLVLIEANKLVKEASPRDYTGIISDGKTTNIATAYNTFKYRLNRKINNK